MTTIDWVIVFGLNIGVIACGLYIARGTSTSREWFLGARALAWWAVGLSMFATNIDNADLVSITSTASREGIHIISVHTVGTVLAGILAAFFIVPAMYRDGHYTNAEYLEARFGVSTRVLSALIQIQYRTSMLGLMIWSVHVLLTRIVDLSSGAAWGLIAGMVALATLYAAWGGLKSVVLTDAIQGLVMIAGALVVLGSVWNVVGGWEGVVERLDGLSPRATTLDRPPADITRVSGYRGDGGITPPVTILLAWMIVAGGYWTVNHTQTMRLMGTRSLWDMKMAALLGTAISAPVMIACAMLGIFGRALYPDLHDPATMYPTLVNRFLAPGMKGLVIAGVVAAAMSTFDSMGSALSAVFTRDVYARLLVRDREDSHYLRVGRWATAAILSLGFAYVPFIRTKDTMLEAFLTLIPVFVTPLFVLYLAGALTRAHRRSGCIGLLAGAFYGIVALMDREGWIEIPWLPPWFTGRWEALPWAAAITAVTITVATLVMGTEKEQRARDLSRETTGWLARSRESELEIVEHPFSDHVPLLLRPGWIAALLLGLAAWVVLVVFW